VPNLLRRWRRDPWDGFRDAAKQPTRIAAPKSEAARAKPAPGGRVSGIVIAHKPRKRG
jgi:hypothetical protein